MKATSFILFALSFLVQSTLHGSTGVGNGGDVVDTYLEATREILVRTAGFVRDEKDQENICECQDLKSDNPFCIRLTALSVEERAFCREFLSATVRQIIDLNRRQPITPFEVSQEALQVPDEAGRPRPVLAVTPLGPDGKVTFHYDGIKLLSPMAILALMAHEFGHKVSFEEHYVEDNQPIGPFDFAGGGRALLDTAAAALSWYAFQAGLIGQAFSVKDRFECEIFNVQRPEPRFKSEADSNRQFVGNNSLETYKAGVGMTPSDMQCTLSESDTSELSFKVTIHENNNCDQSAREARLDRQTVIQLWRFFKGDEKEKLPELVSERIQPRLNPLCNDVPSLPLTTDAVIGPQTWRFSVRYLGSSAGLF